MKPAVATSPHAVLMQPWRCRVCEQSGKVRHDPALTLQEVWDLVEDDHRRVSKHCDSRRGGISIELPRRKVEM